MTYTGCPQYSVKYYTDDLYKLVKFNRPLMPRQSEKVSRECPNERALDESGKYYSAISRAKSTIYQIGVCNDWPFFCTFTIDPDKWNRYEFAPFYKAFTQWIRDYRKKYKCKIEYCFVPERHKDDAWHLHGFIRGIPMSHLSKFVRFKHPQELVDGNFLNWEACSEKFGYCSLGFIKSSLGAAAYVTKYITKDLLRCNSSYGAHLYMCSIGLRRAVSLGYVYGEHSRLDAMLTEKGTFCQTGWVKSVEYGPLWQFDAEFLGSAIVIDSFCDVDPADPEVFVEFAYELDQLDLFEGDEICGEFSPWPVPS